jgi:serine/threonine protein kinase
VRDLRWYTSQNAPSTFERVDHDYIFEEETVPEYDPKHYYPVSIGDIFRERYKVIGKLGFGSASTVWLCRDLDVENDFVALKIYINSSKHHRERPIYDRINELETNHEGRKYVRKMYTSFDLEGPHGNHICLVHQPLGMSLGEMKEICPDEVFTVELIQQLMRFILSGLDYLHKEVQIIHTGRDSLEEASNPSIPR